jgi:hypothetical protein
VSNRFFNEKLNLSDFPGVSKTGIIIWEYIQTVISSHQIELPLTSLRQNHRACITDSRQFGSARVTASAEDVVICPEKRVKRNDHGLLPIELIAPVGSNLERTNRSQ